MEDMNTILSTLVRWLQLLATAFTFAPKCPSPHLGPGAHSGKREKTKTATIERHCSWGFKSPIALKSRWLREQVRSWCFTTTNKIWIVWCCLACRSTAYSVLLGFFPKSTNALHLWINQLVNHNAAAAAAQVLQVTNADNANLTVIEHFALAT